MRPNAHQFTSLLEMASFPGADKGYMIYIPMFRHSLLRYDGLEARQSSKPQNRKTLFDVELYLNTSSCTNPFICLKSQLHIKYYSSQLSLLDGYLR
jgi:hypothetical protein